MSKSKTFPVDSDAQRILVDIVNAELMKWYFSGVWKE